MRRKPRTKMPPEEDYARMLEDGLVYLTCCQVGAARLWCPAVLNMTHSFRALAEERARRGLRPLPAPREMAAGWRASVFWAPSRFGGVAHLSRVGPASRSAGRLRLWGLPASEVGPVHGTTLTMRNDGTAFARDNYYRIRDPDDGRRGWARTDLAGAPTRVTPDARSVELYLPVENHEPCFHALVAWGVGHLWSVTLAQADSPALRFFTSASGVQEFFTLRDRPEGRDRRSALRHWVRAHTRVLHGAAGREVSVRAHLRGAEAFDWFGLRGHVHAPEAETPPEPDAAPESG